MKKNNIKNKRVIISIVIIMVLIVISVIIYNNYQQKQLQNKIDIAIEQIEEVEKDYTAKDSRDEKIEILKSLLNDYEKYENSKDSHDEVKTHYKVAIENIRKNFKLEYDKTIKENTLNDIENITDKDKLNEAKTNLTTLLETITNEVDVVCTIDEMKEYESKINELNVKYDLRVESINEEENKAKEEEEAKNISNSNNIVTNDGGNSASSSAGGSTSNNSGSSNAPVNTPTAPTPEVSTPAPAPETPSTPSNGENSNPGGYPLIPGTNIPYRRWIANDEGIITHYIGVDGIFYDSSGVPIF